MIHIRSVVSYSPLRISFGGGGTDIAPFPENHGGAVINTTIDRGVTVTYREDQYPLEISSRDFVSSYILSSHNGSENVLEKLLSLFGNNGITTGRVIINSDVPPGSGLGSSSALTTAVLKLIYELKGEKKSGMDIAEEAFRTESERFGVTLGKQDPYAISIGGFKFMKFEKDGVYNFPVRAENDFAHRLQDRILLIYTGETRESSDVLREQVEKASRNDDTVISNLVRMRDLAREMNEAVLENSMDNFIEHINEGWNLKKKLGANVTNSRIDGIIASAMENGAQGGKLMGGGSQGFLLIVSKEGRIAELQKAMLQHSRFVIRIKFDPVGTRILKNDP